MCNEQNLEEMRAELRGALDAAERRQLAAEIEELQKKLYDN